MESACSAVDNGGGFGGGTTTVGEGCHSLPPPVQVGPPVPLPSLPPQQDLFDTVLFAGGHIGPFLQQISLSSDHVERAATLVMKAIHPLDIMVFLGIAYLTVPLFGFIYSTYLNDDKEIVYPYSQSYMHWIANCISEGAKIAIGIYLLDCIILIAVGLGLYVYHVEKLSRVLAKIVYIVWLAHKFSVVKRHFINKALVIKSDKLGKLSIIDRLMDGIIFSCTAFALLEILDMEMGAGIKSMFAFGSVGTLIVGLASRDLAGMFVNGLALSTTNRISEGDEIRFGDGTTGIVQSIGWIHTVIRNYDNLLEEVPNSQLGMQRVKNLSRVNMSRVQQNLRFHYKDIDLLPKVLQDIVEEIKIQCSPEVITDGSRPLRAVWTSYREDHVQVVVTAHFNGIRPSGNKYLNIQQRCLFAIHDAVVKKNNIQFVTTFYPQPNGGGGGGGTKE